MTLSISVVIFDLGNTLLYLDSDIETVYPLMNQALADELIRLGYLLSKEDFITTFIKMMKDADDLGDEIWIEIPTKEIVKAALLMLGFSDVPEDHIRQALEKYYAISQNHWVLEEDTISMLKELKENGYKLGIISNASDALDVHRLLCRDDLAVFFDKVLISSQVGVLKPHPEIFHQVLEFFETEPEQAAFVGDTLIADIAGSKHAGMHSIWVTRRARRPDNLEYLGKIIPDHQIDTLAELPGLLQRVSAESA